MTGTRNMIGFKIGRYPISGGGCQTYITEKFGNENRVRT
jgi:hypothetical protein